MDKNYETTAKHKCSVIFSNVTSNVFALTIKHDFTGVNTYTRVFSKV